MEPFLGIDDQPWNKFMNNDGQEVDESGPASLWPPDIKEFQMKSQSFSHWTFQKFKGKAFVCNLQGELLNMVNLI